MSDAQKNTNFTHFHSHSSLIFKKYFQMLVAVQRNPRINIIHFIMISRPHNLYPLTLHFYIGSVRGSPNGTIGNFTNGTIGSQCYHWLTNGTNGTIGRINSTIGITIGTNGITNGTIGRTLNDIGIPLVPLVEP